MHRNIAYKHNVTDTHIAQLPRQLPASLYQ